MQAVNKDIPNGIAWKLSGTVLVLVKRFETEIETQVLVLPNTITHPISLSGSKAGYV
jgi:hypothetical protein